MLLVDGNGLVCRLWYANANEVPQRFARVAVRVSTMHELLRIVVAWDSRGPTWRHEIWPKYKAGRHGKPALLLAAIRECRRLPQLEHVEAASFEADDVIATLVRAEAGRVLILTHDKDLLQLVTINHAVVDERGELTCEADVARRRGVLPSQLRHLLSWMGDTTDGLPGVRGIGPKKAIPHALAGEIGDEMTYELLGLATVPTELLLWRNQPMEANR